MGILFCCMRPCGLSEVIRLVHFNGYVEEMNKPVKAREVMEAHPDHLIGQPSYLGIVRSSSLLPPDADLQVGNIYFLLPTTPKSSPSASPSPSPFPSNPGAEPPMPLRRTCSLASPNTHHHYPLKSTLTRAESSDGSHVRPGRPVLVAAPPAPFLFKRDDKVAQLIISRQCLAEILRTQAPRSSVTIEDREDDWRLTKKKMKKKKKKKKKKEKTMSEERESHALLPAPSLKPSIKLQKEKAKEEEEEEKEEDEEEEGEPLSPCLPSSSSKSVTWRANLESIHVIS